MTGLLDRETIMQLFESSTRSSGGHGARRSWHPREAAGSLGDGIRRGCEDQHADGGVREQPEEGEGQQSVE